MPAFDTTTLIIVAALVVAAIALFLLLRGGGRQRVEIETKAPDADPYAASRDRPYVDSGRTEARPLAAERVDAPLPETAEPVRPPMAEAAPAAEPAPAMEPAPEPRPVPPPAAPAADGPQGNSVLDQQATAAADVAGQVLGVAARAELPGAGAAPDDLQQLKGVGPKFAARLNELGITRYAQLAALDADGIARLDAELGPFRGRLARDRVGEQASHLARGDVDGFEAKFGKLGGK